MKKIVKKFGGSYVITFSSQEREIYKIVEGSVIDLSDLTVCATPLYFNEKETDKNITKVLREYNGS